MLSPDRIMMSPSPRSSAPVSIESSHVHSQDSIDEKHQPNQPGIEEEEHDADHKTLKIELKRPRCSLAQIKRKASIHQNNPTVNSIKKWYQIRGWSLLYPLVVSLFLAIGELEFDLRMTGYAFVVFSCVFCLCHMRNFESRKNLGFALLIILCMLVVLCNFLFQFSFIGDKGWAATESYQICYNFAGFVRNKNIHDKLCSVFKTAFYLNSLVYFTTMSSFGVYLLGTSKLLKLINHGVDRNGYITQLDDEVDLDD